MPSQRRLKEQKTYTPRALPRSPLGDSPQARVTHNRRPASSRTGNTPYARPADGRGGKSSEATSTPSTTTSTTSGDDRTVVQLDDANIDDGTITLDSLKEQNLCLDIAQLRQYDDPPANPDRPDGKYDFPERFHLPSQRQQEARALRGIDVSSERCIIQGCPYSVQYFPSPPKKQKAGDENSHEDGVHEDAEGLTAGSSRAQNSVMKRHIREAHSIVTRDRRGKIQPRKRNRASAEPGTKGRMTTRAGEAQVRSASADVKVSSRANLAQRSPPLYQEGSSKALDRQGERSRDVDRQEDVMEIDNHVDGLLNATASVPTSYVEATNTFADTTSDTPSLLSGTDIATPVEQDDDDEDFKTDSWSDSDPDDGPVLVPDCSTASLSYEDSPWALGMHQEVFPEELTWVLLRAYAWVAEEAARREELDQYRWSE